MSWIPLHVYSQYSILEASAPIEGLAEKAAALHMPAMALTDMGNLYGAVEFFKACKAVGVKPIIGCEFYIAPGSRHEKKRIPGSPFGYPLVLLAKNKQGYQNLCKLSSLAFLEGFYYAPRIDKELLAKHSEGLICLSGPLEGHLSVLAAQEREAELIQEACYYRDLFKNDFYLEIQRHTMTNEQIHTDGINQEGWAYQKYADAIKNQETVIARFKTLSKELGIGCVATQGSRYLERDDWQAHEVLINIQSGEPCEIWEKDSFGQPKTRVLNPKRQTMPSHVLYFKSAEEMRVLFADYPEALDVTLEIAAKCEFAFDFKIKSYPVFVPPDFQGSPEERPKAAEDFLRKLCEEGIAKRYTPARLAKVQEKYPGKNPLDVVRERLSGELDIITSKGMGDYLLIVYDFIAWAKNQGIPMGPGRGSGAGSIILYLIGITDIEPLRFNLFFERFINPERISYPDIDVDICMERRHEVIEYTIRKYGKERVAQIITFGTMKAKMAIKDVGRVLSVPLAKVNIISKLVPEDPNMTLEKALELDPDLQKHYASDEEVKRVIDLAKKLEGSVRSTGIHAAGLIIGSTPLMDHIPLCNAKDSEIVATQFSMKPVEAVGMLKIDFLGLKTLTSIQKTVDAIKVRGNVDIDWIDLPLEDKATFELLNQGKTLGIFQLESGGMQELAKQLHIDKFEEIIAVGALYRPGPMEMIPSFVARKHGKETIDIDHPLMREVLAETYGIMVYQEQVMQIASRLAKYSLGEGDVLRRAMGKKDKEEMGNQRQKFREGSLSNGIDVDTSMRIFDKIEKFASYGFNKSHAAAYGYLTYVTAYLKVHYPGEWMAALMTCDREDLSKVSKVIHECQAMNIAILPPDVNESDMQFVATAQGIRFAVTAIKGVGEGVVESILKERRKNGAYRSFYDFIKRVDVKKVGKKTAQTLIEAGCFDFTGWHRQELIESIDPMYDMAVRQQKETSQGIMNLFALSGDDQEERFSKPPETKEKMSKQTMLKRENELLGFYLTGHPLDEFRPLMQRLSCVPLSTVATLDHDSVCRTIFIIESVQLRISSKNQKKFAILTIGDEGEHFELPVWSELYEAKQQLLTEYRLVYAVVQVDRSEDEVKLKTIWLSDLSTVDEAAIKSCDEAFDRAKVQIKNSEFRNKKKSQEAKEVKEAKVVPQKPGKLHLKLDADQLRLSHILEIKKLFRSFAGETTVQIDFIAKKGKVGQLAIDSNWGVQFNKQFEDALRKLPFLVSLQYDK
jgi:DNA polymerase-3 subunit alpha